jgi:hypothetical protein
MKIGDPITTFRDDKLVSAYVWAISPGFDGREYLTYVGWHPKSTAPSGWKDTPREVCTDAEGVEWLPGHGPEIEAALAATRLLLDDEPTVPVPFPRVVRVVCSGPLVLGQAVAMKGAGTVGPAVVVHSGSVPVLGIVKHVYLDHTVDVLLIEPSTIESPR